MFDYEEACPVSKAASVLCERWTLQIVREMLLGATRFSELQQLLPKMSPTLLNSRLKSLEAQGILIRKKIREKKAYEYVLSPCGQELKPVVVAMGMWGMKWAFEQMDEDQLNDSAIVRDFAYAIDRSQLPAGDTVIQFNLIKDEGKRTKFVLIRDGKAQYCDENLGAEVDVYLTASLLTFGEIWFGRRSLNAAIKQGELKVVGESCYVNSISKWLKTSQFSSE